MSFTKKTAVTAVFFAVITSTLYAGNDAEDLGVIEVNARKKYGEISDKPVSMSVVRPGSADSGKSAGEIASSAAGVRIKSSGNGDEIMVRGAGANQTPVYIDGVLQTDSSACMLRSDEIERVEIYRGYVPGNFSAPGIGGAVNIITRKAANNSTEAGMSVTSTGYESFLRNSTVHGKFSNNFSVMQLDDRGDFRYRNDNGTPAYNSSDDFTEKRRNNRTTRLSAGDTLACTLSSSRIWGSLSGQYQRKGIPGVDTVQVLNARKNHTDLAVQGGFELFSKNIVSASRFVYRSGETLAVDPRQEILNTVYDRRCLTETSGYQQFGISAGDFNTALSFSCSKQSYEKDEKFVSYSRDYPVQNRTLYSGAADMTYDFASGRFTALLQSRGSISMQDFYDEYTWVTTGEKASADNQYSVYGGHAAVIARVIPETFNLRAGAGRSYRIPDPEEVYGSAGYVQGNGDLKPEYVDRLEGGFEYFLTKGRFPFSCSANVFYSDAYDVILYIQNSQRTLKACNISRAVINGAEVTAQIRLFSFAGAGGNYTWQYARDNGEIDYYNGKLLPHRPQHEAQLYLLAGIKQIEMKYSADIVSYYFLDRANTQANYQPSSVTHTVAVSAVAGDLSLAAACRNITDIRHRDSVGYPLPGRTFVLSAAMRL